MPVLQPWDTDPEFVALMREIQGRTLVDPVRCWVLRQYAQYASGVPGDMAEVGVYKGGTARLIARSCQRKVHLFDTFAGMPPCDSKRDMHREGAFKDTSLEAVKDFLKDCDNVVFHPGTFPATAAEIVVHAFSFVHVDCDIYRSVLDCCEFFLPIMSCGGVVVFDDYGAVSCPGAKSAVDEYCARGILRTHFPVYLPTGQAVVVKL